MRRNTSLRFVASLALVLASTPTLLAGGGGKVDDLIRTVNPKTIKETWKAWKSGHKLDELAGASISMDAMGRYYPTEGGFVGNWFPHVFSGPGGVGHPVVSRATDLGIEADRTQALLAELNDRSYLPLYDPDHGRFLPKADTSRLPLWKVDNELAKMNAVLDAGRATNERLEEAVDWRRISMGLPTVENAATLDRIQRDPQASYDRIQRMIGTLHQTQDLLGEERTDPAGLFTRPWNLRTDTPYDFSDVGRRDDELRRVDADGTRFVDNELAVLQAVLEAQGRLSDRQEAQGMTSIRQLVAAGNLTHDPDFDIGTLNRRSDEISRGINVGFMNTLTAGRVDPASLLLGPDHTRDPITRQVLQERQDAQRALGESYYWNRMALYNMPAGEARDAYLKALDLRYHDQLKQITERFGGPLYDQLPGENPRAEPEEFPLDVPGDGQLDGGVLEGLPEEGAGPAGDESASLGSGGFDEVASLEPTYGDLDAGFGGFDVDPAGASWDTGAGDSLAANDFGVVDPGHDTGYDAGFDGGFSQDAGWGGSEVASLDTGSSWDAGAYETPSFDTSPSFDAGSSMEVDV